jgi:uncharacterized coiled-coil protein SlyX
MNSALGNFNNDGARLSEDGVDMCFERLHKRIVALEDLLAQQASVTNTISVNVHDHVSDSEWQTFELLIAGMLANGASLYELQQRIMGLE